MSGRCDLVRHFSQVGSRVVRRFGLSALVAGLVDVAGVDVRTKTLPSGRRKKVFFYVDLETADEIERAVKVARKARRDRHGASRSGADEDPFGLVRR